MGKGIDLGGLHMNLVTDTLEKLIADKMTAQALAEQRARQGQLDADAREERAFQRRRLETQDARTTRMDDEAREGKLAKEGLELATLYPGKVIKGDTLKRYPKFLHELIATAKDPQLASRSIGGYSNMAGAPQEGEIEIEDHDAVGPDSFELQLPVSERARIAAERQQAAETKRAADERYRGEKLERDTQHRERMAAIAQQRVDKSGGAGGGATSNDDVDALATMIETNPDLLQRLNPTARTKVMARIATRGGGRMRNERADSMRNMLDTATDTVRRLRGDDAQGNKGQGGKGFSAAVGRKDMSSLFGWLDEPIAGTEAAGYAATVDALRSQLTLPELQKMRGMGALSDREFKTLAAGATTLSRALKEGDFLAELDRIEETLAAARSRMPDASLNLGEPITVGDPRPRAGGAAARDLSGGLNGMIKRRMVRVQAPNGAIREVPEDEVSIYTARGGKVVR